MTESLPARIVDEKILLVGATGNVASRLLPILAESNQVFALARYSKPGSKAEVESKGAEAIRFDLGDPDLDVVPDDCSVVLNFAVDRDDGGDFNRQMRVSAEGTGQLMSCCTNASAFFQCSSTAVYQAAGDASVSESSPLGDHHRAQNPTYSIGRIAAEAAARTCAAVFRIPTVIARLGVPYGSVWGFPARDLSSLMSGRRLAVHPDDPQWFSPIHEDDIVATLTGLVKAASVPALVVNWGGDEQVRRRSWCDFMAERLGVPAAYDPDPATYRGLRADTTLRRSITGPTTVPWRVGMSRMIEAAMSVEPG
ncbi:MAG: NAD-dependent epimerase/dehydratase family protein [Acidimicrobiales bacterium]